MSIPGGAPSLFFAPAGAAADFAIDRSLRFNSDDSAHLSKTFSSGSGSTKNTFSFWVKRTKAGQVQQILASGTSNADTCGLGFGYNVNDILFFSIYRNSQVCLIETNRLFRDHSAWYHVVLIYDSTLSTADDRVQIWVNGVREDPNSFRTNDQPAQNTVGTWGKNTLHNISKNWNNASYLNGYLADMHFLDGIAASASDFGEYDNNNVWQPKAYSGSYGTNGFHLDFSDNSSDSALGTDSSGNSNNFTVTNLSVASGSGNDSLRDSPTNGNTASDTGAGGEISGNYPTWNPLDKNTNIALSNGNLDAAETSGSDHFAGRATFKYPATGKWYYEATITTLGGACCIGVDNSGLTNPSLSNSGVFLILVNSSNNVQRYIGSSMTSFDSAYDDPAVGSVLQVAYDADADKLWLGMNNVWMGSGSSANGNPGAGSEATASSVSDPFPVTNLVTSALAVNFGQRPFAHTAPSGYKALCTANLPDPTIEDPSKHFDTKLWTGNNSTQSISLGFSPDLLWYKSLSAAHHHGLQDTVRGVGKALSSSTPDNEATETAGLDSFDSDGFSLDGNYYYSINVDTHEFVGWAWDAGTGSPVSNTDGSITSSVRASQSAGFSIVSWTGTGSTVSIGHGLSAAPKFIISKNRDAVSHWQCFHTNVGNNKFVELSSTGANYTNPDVWNSTDPTSSVFSFISNVNLSGDDFIAYCFAPVEGYSAFGSYTGNGSADGPFVYTGFLIKFLILKRVDSTGGDWRIFDTERDPYNVTTKNLFANNTDQEGGSSGVTGLDIVSNGFKLRASHSALNPSGGTYIYAAFASHPFKTARAR